MGDHRAAIRIVFEVHGQEYEGEWNINYCPNDDDGPDPRICDWFDKKWNESLHYYYDAVAEANIKRLALETERQERAELYKLKVKYPMTARGPSQVEQGEWDR